MKLKLSQTFLGSAQGQLRHQCHTVQHEGGKGSAEDIYYSSTEQCEALSNSLRDHQLHKADKP